VCYRLTRTTRDTSDGILRSDEGFYDGFDRIRFEQHDTLESGPAIVETQYDAFGRLSGRSQPYLTGGSVYQTSFAYDRFGRLIEEKAPVAEGQPAGVLAGVGIAGSALGRYAIGSAIYGSYSASL